MIKNIVIRYQGGGGGLLSDINIHFPIITAICRTSHYIFCASPHVSALSTL